MRGRPVRGSAALGAALLVAVTVAGAQPAGAATFDGAGWWWRVQGPPPLLLPPPPTVPSGGLLVQGGPDGAMAVGAVRFALAPTEADPILTLRVAEGGAEGPDGAVILACAPTSPWVPGDAQPWDQRPEIDDARCTPGEVAADGSTVTFPLGSLASADAVEAIIVPGTTDGQPPSGSNGSTFSFAFEPPTDADMTAAPAAPPAPGGDTSGAGASDPGAFDSGGFDPGPAGPSFDSGSFGAPATGGAPALPPLGPPPSELASEQAGATTPGGAGTPTSAGPLPDLTEPLTAGDLVPLLLVLALGPLAWLATRHPWVATALAGLGAGPAAFAGAPSRHGGSAPSVAPVPIGATDDAEPDGAPVLSCRDVRLSFGGLRALGGVDLDVYEGEIVGLIGPNGAGKTTLMECISGFYEVDEGTITYRGQDLLALKPGDRAGLGIGRTLQSVRLFPYLTVLDNIRVALHRHQRSGVVAHALHLPSALAEERWLTEEAERIVGLVGMEAFADKFASELSYGTLRLLELACMLALQPSLLLLDEPASGISQKETEALGPLLRDIQRATGATILIIEHDMPLVMSLCDRIYCLDAGSVLSVGTPQEIQDDPKVAEAYLGTAREQRKVAAAVARREDASAEVLLEIEGLDVYYDKVQVLYGVDFHVRRGERIALLGTNGAGKSTILKAAAGLVTPAAGTVRWKGEDITAVPAHQRVRLRLGQVPGGRGLFPTLSVGENLRMGGYIYDDERRIDAEVERVVRYFPWIGERADQPAGTLSGGEQQQLATARALMTRPELLMIDELSLGLAPLVIERLMEAVQRLCEDEGLTVVIVEQQASFALGYTDRAYFLEKGEVRYEGPSKGLTERSDLLRSVFLAGASAGFAEVGGANRG